VLVVAAITTGKPLPECGIPARDPAFVVIVVTEDDRATVVLPRLIVAGADLSHVHVICTEDDGSGAPIFPRDLHLLYEMSTAPTLVVVDAWLDTVPSGLVVRDPQGARQALHPWRELSTKTGAAVMLLTHTNRVATGNARDRYGATSELRKKARMTVFARQDDDGRLVIGPEKANSVATSNAAVFAIDAVQHFPATDDDDGTIGRLRFVETSNRTARQHLTDAWEAEHGEDRQDRAAAAEWLHDYLEVEGPQASSAEVKRQAKAAGISERTLQRARKELSVVWGRSGFGKESVTTWSLPSQVVSANSQGGIDGVAEDRTNANPLEHAPRGTSGITGGQQVMPSDANPSDGTTVAQMSDQRFSAVVPPVPRTEGVLIPLPLTAESAKSSANDPNTSHRGSGCVCTGQPQPCHWCVIALSQAAETTNDR
jgi:AAA domain-containing protein